MDRGRVLLRGIWDIGRFGCGGIGLYHGNTWLVGRMGGLLWETNVVLGFTYIYPLGVYDQWYIR